jgi:hypothetical protein
MATSASKTASARASAPRSGCIEKDDPFPAPWICRLNDFKLDSFVFHSRSLNAAPEMTTYFPAISIEPAVVTGRFSARPPSGPRSVLAIPTGIRRAFSRGNRTTRGCGAIAIAPSDIRAGSKSEVPRPTRHVCSTQTEDIGTRTAQVPFVPRGDAKTIKKGIRARRRAGLITIEACMASFVVALAT